MRSSKKRSRSSQNRPRPLGNIINRVFDSSGPEGKVRGTPQQIIEKYQQLARDAQLSNDRVAAENFLQHAEHYTRMLAEAQREMAAEQEARQSQYQQGGNPQGGGQQGGNPQGGGQSGNGGQNGGQNGNRDYRDRDRDYRDRDDRRDRDFRDPGAEEQPAVEVIDIDGTGTGLVETPEARRRDDAAPDDAPRRDRDPNANRERRDRRDRDFRRDREDRRRDQAEAPAAAPVAAPVAAPAPVVAPPAATKAVTKAVTKAELPSFITGAPPAEVAAKPDPKPRKPRKPKAEAAPTDGSKPE